MKDFKVYLSHILSEIAFIEQNSVSMGKWGFMENPVICRATLRSLEIIGEAVKNIPDGYRDLYPSIPWKEFAGLRDVLIHKYFGVDYEMIWDIISNELPDLKNSIEKIFNSLQSK